MLLFQFVKHFFIPIYPTVW